MGNYSRDPALMLAEALARNYSRVRFQQGKPALDREFNLAADLADPRRLASRYLGNGVAGNGKDFSIGGLNAGGGEFTIGAGKALVGGLEVVLAADTTYRSQPNQGGVGALPAGPFLIYLKAGEKEVGAGDDPDLGNVGDVTFETSLRSQIDWQVLTSLAPVDSVDHLLLASVNGGVVTDRRRLGLALAQVHDAASDALARADAAQAGVVALAPQVVSRLKRTIALETNFPLAAPPAPPPPPALPPAKPFHNVVVVTPANRHAMLLASVTVTQAGGVVSWREYTGDSANGFVRGFIVTNEGNVAVSVSMKIYELSDG